MWRIPDPFRGCHAIWNGISAFVLPSVFDFGICQHAKAWSVSPISTCHKKNILGMAVQKCYQELPVARNASMVFYGILWHASLGASQASFKEFSFAAPNAWDLQLPPSSICHCWVKCGAPSQGVVPVPLTRQLRWPTLKPGHLEHGRSYWLLHWNPSVRCPGDLLTWTKLQSKGNNMASWQPWLHGKKQSAKYCKYLW